MKNRKKSSFVVRRLFLSFLFLCLLGLGVGFIPWYQQGIAAQNQGGTFNALFIYEEETLAIDENKEIFPCFQDGNRVGVGEKIGYQKRLTLSGMEECDIFATSAGIVKYQLDGFENILQRESITNLSLERLFQKAKEGGFPKERGIKIIDNHAPVYLVASFPKENVSLLDKGDSLGLVLNKKEATGHLLEVFFEEENALCLLRLEPNDLWYQERTTFVKII